MNTLPNITITTSMSDYNEKFYQYISEIYLNFSLCKSKKEFQQKYPEILNDFKNIYQKISLKHNKLNNISCLLHKRQKTIK